MTPQNNYAVAIVKDGQPIAWLDSQRQGHIGGPWNGTARCATRLTEEQAEIAAKQWRRVAEQHNEDFTVQALYLPTFL